MIKGNWILGNEDISVPIAVRRTVFEEEMGLTGFGADKDDNFAMHSILFDENIPAASSRIYFDGERFLLDRICVIKNFRNKGIGDLLARLTILRASEYARVMYIHCFEDVGCFFKRYGFKEMGKEDHICGKKAVWLKAEQSEIKLVGECGDCHDCHGCKYGENK